MLPASRPTLEDVAARAGVGRGTASRAIAGTGGVKESTRVAVLAAARELGYRPNVAARSLVTRQTGMITLVLGESGDRMFVDPFFADVVRGLGRGLRNYGQRLALLPLDADHDSEDALDYLASGHTDGVVLVSAHAAHDLGAQLAAHDLPVVRIGRALPEDPLAWVDVDNVTGGRLATGHLIDRGCRAPAHVTGALDLHSGWARREGYRLALAEAGLGQAPREVAGDFGWVSGRNAALVIMDRWRDTDGIFAASDLAAAGVLSALAELGVAVPDQVRVVGYDDSAIAATISPGLSTVRQPVYELGWRAAKVMTTVLAGSNRPHELLPVELVTRASS